MGGGFDGGFEGGFDGEGTDAGAMMESLGSGIESEGTTSSGSESETSSMRAWCDMVVGGWMVELEEESAGVAFGVLVRAELRIGQLARRQLMSILQMEQFNWQKIFRIVKVFLLEILYLLDMTETVSPPTRRYLKESGRSRFFISRLLWSDFPTGVYLPCLLLF